MTELVRFIAEKLVDNPSAMEVTSFDEEGALVVELKVAPTDMGKVIGKQGRIAKAIRTIVKASASRRNEVVLVDIVE